MSKTDSSQSAFHQHERQRQELEPRSPSARTNDAQETISCLKCAQSNSRANRFCRQCGSILWRKCPRCGDERPIDESFCAACGTDIGSAEQQSSESYRKQLQDTLDMIARLELNDALRTLRYLAEQNHPSLEEVRATARQLIPEVTARRDRYEQLATVHEGRAQILLEELRFAEAAKELNQIPGPLRDRTARELLAHAVSTLHEIEKLKLQILKTDGVAFPDRVAAIQPKSNG